MVRYRVERGGSERNMGEREREREGKVVMERYREKYIRKER